MKRPRIDDDVKMSNCDDEVMSPPAKRAALNMGAGVLTHFSSQSIVDVPSPVDFFDGIHAAVTFQRKYRSRTCHHFVVGAYSSIPGSTRGSGASSLLIIMGSTDTCDYVAHLAIEKSVHAVRILKAWTQILRVVDTDDTPPRVACPLARVVRDVVGKPLHLACALSHCNMNAPRSTRAPPMTKLGCMANHLHLEYAVAASRERRRAAMSIQRAWRRHSRASKDSMGTRLLVGLFQGMHVD